jgi:cob(I)alamin adenosyltransferase
MMNIYTRTGDRGTTGLWGGQRVAKDSLRVAAYGEVDELNAMLGVVRACGVDPSLDEALARVQNELFVVGADLATPGEATRIDRTSDEATVQLEHEIDQFETELEPLRQFILPGGSLPSAYLHLARTVCRRAERRVVTLASSEPVNQTVLSYLNRLSDWLFVLARLVNARSGVADVPWKSLAR